MTTEEAEIERLHSFIRQLAERLFLASEVLGNLAEKRKMSMTSEDRERLFFFIKSLNRVPPHKRPELFCLADWAADPALIR